MHPNPAFRHDDRDLFEALIAEIGFGMIFATVPDGPRVAHVPLHSTGDGALQFHLARGNALTRHLDGMMALAVVNGPMAMSAHAGMQIPRKCRRGTMSRSKWKAGCGGWIRMACADCSRP